MNTNFPQTAFRFILHFILRQPYKFAFFALVSIAWALNDAFFPYFIKRIIDTLGAYQGPTEDVFAAVQGPLIGLFAFWIGSELLHRLRGIVTIYTLPKMRAQIRETVFEYVKGHSHEYFSNQLAGNISRKISELPMACQTLVETLFYHFITVIVGNAIILVMMWEISPFFASILLAWLIFHVGITMLFFNRSNRLWEIHSATVSTLSGKVVDILNNIANMRIFSRRAYETEYLSQFQQEETRKAKKAMWFTEWMYIGFSVDGLLLMVGMLLTLIYGWAHQWVTLGDFAQIMMQAFWVLGWVWFISFQIMIVTREVGTINEALTLVKIPHDLIDKPNAKPIVISKGEIQFDKVSFAYRKNKYVFDNLNVVFHSGQKVGLVGFSGSGKSTLVNLILRFYDLQSGRILIDGQDIADSTQESLRAQIAMIPQDPSLFHRSLMENIRYGRLDASDEEVIAASKLAHAHEFIEKLDEGYASLVGERGIKLSGGQRQRIAIARAILKNAPILILDEATSSLDSVTEKLIQQSLHDLMRGRTTLVVAHRLSTLADMDRILVFDQGQIVEDGTQEDLLRRNGHFAMLWQQQSHGFLPMGEDLPEEH